jgi:hypothetical protein
VNVLSRGKKIILRRGKIVFGPIRFFFFIPHIIISNFIALRRRFLSLICTFVPLEEKKS